MAKRGAIIRNLAQWRGGPACRQTGKRQGRDLCFDFAQHPSKHPEQCEIRLYGGIAKW